jgi:hypothetical protein
VIGTLAPTTISVDQKFGAWLQGLSGQHKRPE